MTMSNRPSTSEMPEFLHTSVLDGKGGAKTPSDADILGWDEQQKGVLWLHLDVTDERSRRWLASYITHGKPTVDAMLDIETRPRAFMTEDGLLVVLRGLNTNPGQDPEDMVAIRVWIEGNRIISLRRRKLLSVQDIREAIDKGNGPKTSGDFLSMLVGRLADRIGLFVDDIEEGVATSEENMGQVSQTEFRQQNAVLRRQIAQARRFLAPQRDALDKLHRLPGQLFSEVEAQELRDEADRITRYLEDLDLARERIVVLREEFLGQLAQEQNSRMYVLSIVTAIFLPMTFVTGLLGMNVGGLPGLDNPRGFFGAVSVMATATVVILGLFRWKKWF